jgi:cytochrome o ubiquinol oxidase subunit 1
LRDTTGDPWDGRTLEWSVPSPAPYYNFAITPSVTSQDDFWYAKQNGTKQAEVFTPFHLPKNSPFGLIIASAGGIMCFAIIWHIWWLVAVGMVALLVSTIMRFNLEETEYEVTEDMVRAEQGKEYPTVAELEGAL